MTWRRHPRHRRERPVLGRGAAHRHAADLRHARRAAVRARRRAEPRHRGHHGRRRVHRLARRLPGRGAVDRRRSSRRSPASALGLLHAILTVPLGAVAARVGPRRHAARHEPRLLRLSRAAAAKVTTPPTIEPFAPMAWLGIPVLDGADAAHAAGAASACRCSRMLLNRTPLGLAVRMVGENPSAAEGQGIDVIARPAWAPSSRARR